MFSLFDGDGTSATRATRYGGSYDESHVSIVRGNQPSVLKDLIKGDDRTGKMARFLWFSTRRESSLRRTMTRQDNSYDGATRPGTR